MKHIELPYVPHEKQQIIHDSKAKTKVICAGRRFGKDRCAEAETFFKYAEWADESRPEYLLQPKLNFAYIGPTFSSIDNNWIEFKEFLRPIKEAFDVKVTEDEKRIILPLHDGECHIRLYSADKPDSILGRGFDLCVITEADSIPDEVFDRSVRPMLQSPGRKGFLMLIGTPKREDSYFKRMWDAGQAHIADIESWKFPTTDNPYIDSEAIMAELATMPEHIFRAEYLAEWQSDADAAFRNVDNCIGGVLEKPEKDRAYVIGLDLGKAIDYTVAVVMDKERRKVVDMERFSKIDWTIQKNRVIELVEKFNNALVAIDSANVGSMFSADLKQSKLRVKEVNFHSTIEKERIINGLQLALEKETVKIPQDTKTMPLIAELKLYKRIATNKAGNVMRYVSHRAPIGKHDDCVIALGLALDACPRVGGWDKPIILRAPVGAFPK